MKSCSIPYGISLDDGRLDVFTGGGPLSGATHTCYVWENLGGGKWREHLISVGADAECHEAVGGDVDGDGDIDIAFKPWKSGDTHYYLENKLISK